MVLLALFALVAGAATAVSPCVLPVLPVVLAAGTTGGRRRPLGIVTGITLSFTFATVALVYVIDALGLPGDLLRTVAIVVLLLFGATLIVPAASARVEAVLTRLAPRPAHAKDDAGFWSGLVVGLSLGLVYAPCAGPILAGVITVSASQSFTAGRLLVAFAYALGSAIVLYGLMLGGRRITRPLSRHSGRFQVATGVVMVVMGVAMLGDLDTRFQTAIASHLPSVLVDPTAKLEKSVVRMPHPSLGQAPDFTGNQRWFNTPGDRPLHLSQLRGHVVLVDFWTYTCINCIRTLPYLKALDQRYRDNGLVIVGVHTPEFPFEREASNVERAIKQNGIRYPVVQDNKYATWDAYGNQYWPAEYLIDAKGRVRFTHFGEGGYREKERVVRQLLAEAGHAPRGDMTNPHGQVPDPLTSTPETYLGTSRTPHPPGYLSFIGPWHREPDDAESGPGSRLRLQFTARRVFLVLGSPDRARSLDVILDGKPYRHLLVRQQRLYTLVNLPRAGLHELELRPESGIYGYAFTFG
ncbi:MAG TPA: cytochrome c biogenesis protein CcdA [Thermoleophilaceae bacterium]|nr:cytochrome c biogenesis protein CcdA [Thermoleophilaceae bacterium]